MPFADFVLLFVLNTSPDALCRVFFFKFVWFVSRMSHKALNPWEESAGFVLVSPSCCLRLKGKGH